MTREDLIQALVANNDGKKDDLIIAIEKAMNYGYNVAIDKACEWLKDNAYSYLFGDRYNDEQLLDDFRKAMQD